MRAISPAYAMLCLCAMGAGAAQAEENLPAGGLSLSQPGAIELSAEELLISQEAVRARYTFVNTAAAEAKSDVVFKLPERGAPSAENMDIIPVEGDNFLGAAMKVGGAQVEFTTTLRALVEDADVTDAVERAKLPVNPYISEVWDGIAALSDAQKAELLKANILSELNDEEGDQSAPKTLSPNWRLSTTLHWNQTFPAQKETVIEHSYQPSVGDSSGSWGFSANIDEELDYYRKSFCMDEAGIDAIKRIPKDKQGFREHRIEYILGPEDKPGKPIKDFRLVVDKGAPENLVAFCAQGERKAGATPTQIEVRAKDFVPAGSLHVLIFTPVKDER